MRGFILAAGFGTRLKPITDALPKALVPVCGEPLLAHNLRALDRSGVFSALGVNSHYLHELMERFQRESSVPFELFYESDKIRGTGGALDFARDFLSADDTFLIANVDILHKFDIAELASRFVDSGRICSQVSIPTDGLGTVLYDNATGDYLGVADDREELMASIQTTTADDVVEGRNNGRLSGLLRRFAPRNDGQRIAPRNDGQRIAPRNDGQRIAPRNDGQRFAPRNDRHCERSEAIQPVSQILEADFTGVAFYRREFLDFVNKDDFSIVPVWKRAALSGQPPGMITPNKDAAWWMDIGTHAALAEIEAEVGGGRIDLWN